MIARAGAVAAVLLIVAAGARAEQKVRMGDYEAHYALVPTTMLGTHLATDYGISRAPDQVLLTISVIDARGTAVHARVSGVVRDLLGQERALYLREVVEGDAVYYLTGIRHDDEDVLRFDIEVTTPDGRTHALDFQQKVYLEGP